MIFPTSPHQTPLGQTPLGQTPLGQTPLGQTPLAQTPLHAAPSLLVEAAEHLPLSPALAESPIVDDVTAKTIQINCLPEPIAQFMGRGRELQAIERMVAEGIRVIEISDWQGRGGVGKSALAVQTAHYLQRALPNFQPNIQLYANLHGNDSLPRDAKDVLQEFFLMRFGLDPTRLPQKVHALQQVYQQRLDQQQALIVLDNVANFRQIEPLLPLEGSHLVLITSRKPILEGDCGETLFLEGLAESTSIQLLNTMAGQDRIPQTGAMTRQLLQLSGRLPLTIRLLGAFLRYHPDYSLEMLVLRLQQERIKFKEYPPQTVDLIACINLVYGMLPPHLQGFLQRLSVLRGDDFDIAIASYLNGLDDHNQTREHLRSLIAQQWLMARGRGRNRFYLHDIVRLMLWEKVQPQTRQKLLMRALAWQDRQTSPLDKILLFKQRSA